ncbi:DegT/DnrJ/EryC1/StrS family aminotransferase [Candidatus Bathyarchaeota archaeon]|nr:DegT/DnrJ/EryC1/StrS family aminotransferase [Candidatus Bathyarchaeota archaeon]
MAKLAINGGPAEASELKSRIPSWPKASTKAKKALLEALESGKWCRVYSGSKAEQFEKAFASYHDAKHGIAVANGTVSLELSLKTGKIGFGDEVLVPAVTFIASASAITEVGAVPRFVDIDPETAVMSPKALKDSITDMTKAVLVVHYAGYPVDFDEILPIVRRNGLFLVEDCAHAHGTEWKGRKVGAIGDMGSFSFQESKSLASGEGGIVLTDNDVLAERARLMHNIGRVVGRPGYEHFILSSNYRLSELQAALLLAKLDELPKEVEEKHVNGEYLAEKLMRIGGVEPLKRDQRITKRGYYFFVIRYDKTEFNGLPKKRFIEALNAEGVPAGSGYGMPLYKQPAFKKENLDTVIPKGVKTPDYERLSLPGAEKYIAEEVTLPHPILLSGKEGLDLVVNSIQKIKENVDELL